MEAAKKPAVPPAPAQPSKTPPTRGLDSRKMRFILLAGMGLSLLLFLAVLSAGLSFLGTKSKAMVELKVQNQTADAQLANLEQAKKQVEKYGYFKEVARTVIPNDKNQAEDILEINRLANEAGISIQSITFPASTLGLSVSSLDATSSSSSSTAISQAKPVSGIAGLYSLELTITPETTTTALPGKAPTYNKMLDFLNRIENNRHTAQITEVDITPSGQGNSVLGSGFSFVLKINIFIKP